jgi:hypothetical protein
MLDEALAISDGLVAEHPNIPDYAVSQVQIRLRLAYILWQSDPSGTETHLRKALDLQSALARRFPQNFFYKLEMARIRESLAKLLDKRDRLLEACSAM